ncbi:hydrogenase maturation protease [Streptomyces sp. NPDC054841]
MEPRSRIALIGLGHDFRRDDGVGWAVIDTLRERTAGRPLLPDADVATCDGEPARLVGLWHDAELAVVVDSAHAYPDDPGRVTRLDLDGERLAQPEDDHPHGKVLGEAIELSRALGRLPGRLVVYAVQVVDSTVGSGLSPAVAAMVELVAGCVADEIARYQATQADEDLPASPHHCGEVMAHTRSSD